MGNRIEWGQAQHTAVALETHGTEIGDDRVDDEAALSFGLDGAVFVIEGDLDQLHDLIERQHAALDNSTPEDNRPLRTLDALSDALDCEGHRRHHEISGQIREAIALGVLLATAPTRSDALDRFLPEDDDLDKARGHLDCEPAADLATAIAFIEATE
jgi:hypothetical protein